VWADVFGAEAGDGLGASHGARKGDEEGG
jgi:hypothetical protein